MMVYRDKALEALGEQPILESQEMILYQRESTPLTDETSAVPLDQLLTALTESQKRLLALLEAVSHDRLAASADAEDKRTIGDRIEFLHWHETYHVGQLEILRQLTGKNDAII